MQASAITDAARRPLKVGGFVPFTTTDYPGKLAAVVFVQGCPWQCVYCHNPHLQLRCETGQLNWERVLIMLQRRTGLLDAVVFSGGEPTLDPALKEAINDVRSLGFQIGLHTGGAYPRRLAEILPLVDWVGLDIKAPFADYARITGVEDSGEQALTCAQMILASGIPYEFRTTIHPDLISNEALLTLAETLACMGAQNYALQLFRKEGCQNESLRAVAGHHFGEGLLQQVKEALPKLVLRGV